MAVDLERFKVGGRGWSGDSFTSSSFKYDRGAKWEVCVLEGGGGGKSGDGGNSLMMMSAIWSVEIELTGAKLCTLQTSQ